ncbi:TRAP transporter small permease subunit [Aliikangiella sp. G2MR2-5]|uniref:TRAP transporter small permease subunit n=1 Tax=Aliikangiella sp. G2MR2-5 TaxID=2788943 RepID=UPI0018AB83CE|nr:TRAP transporter small permease subunit [Aliikangiella sp. G2MR2-5]
MDKQENNNLNIFEKTSVLSGRLISWLTIGMVVLLSINVLSSWLFQSSSILASEAVTWMHSANFLLAAAYTLNKDEHVRVDIFYAKMSERGQALINLLGTLLLLLPVTTFIIWASWSYVAMSWKIGEVSAEAGGMPALYLLKSLLIVMPVLLIIEAVNQLIKNFARLTNGATTSPNNSQQNSCDKEGN